MKDGKKRDKMCSLLQCDNRDRVYIRAVIILALAAVLGLVILGLVIGESNRKNVGADVLAEEFGRENLTEEFSEDSVGERTEGESTDKTGQADGTGQAFHSSGNITIDSRQKDMNANEKSVMPDLSDRYIYFAGYEDCFVGEGEQMALVNLPENGDIYIAYTVYLSDTGEAVFATELIAPGNSVEWVVSEDLEPGEYRLSLYQVPYILDNHGNFLELISASNEMTIVVK